LSALAGLHALVRNSRNKFDFIYLSDLVTSFFAELLLRTLVRR